MGKKKVSVLGSENEDELRAKKAVKLEQKKLRTGKATEATPEVILSEVKDPENIVAASEIPKSPKSPHIRSKSYQAAKSQVDVLKTYSIPDGLKLLRQISVSKFDPTVELHITLADKIATREVDLPHPTGKTRRIAIATDETIAEITTGKITFDVLLASPDQMSKLVRLAKVLGPRGLMPNPKTGTVVPDPAKTAKDLASRISVTLKTEKDAPVIHTLIGKLSGQDSALTANITAILDSLAGRQIKKVVLKSTHSPAIKLAF